MSILRSVLSAELRGLDRGMVDSIKRKRIQEHPEPELLCILTLQTAAPRVVNCKMHASGRIRRDSREEDRIGSVRRIADGEDPK